MGRVLGAIRSVALALCALQLNVAQAAGPTREQAVIAALKLSHAITGGYMSPTDPEGIFQNMVSKIQEGDTLAAASLAANSRYFASYLGRRLAFQMQNLAMDASLAADNDSTAFILAHFVGGAGAKPSISTLWSENATYAVNINGTSTRVAAMTPAQIASVNWLQDMVRVDGQRVRDAATANATVTLPPKHVGGFMTLSDRINDRSFAMNTATAGTNLRMVAGMWTIATGLEVIAAASTQAKVQDVPRFVPQNDPNFFRGQGQPACISCHSGGMASLSHGYSTFADIFDFDATKGLVYIANPTTNTKKSLGSDPAKRAGIAACNLVTAPKTDCNPDGTEAFANQKWDVKLVWEDTGMLSRMGWRGATSGEGLNTLGAALGKADIVYEFLAKRVAKEVCPTGDISEEDLKAIGATANPLAKPAGTDDIRTIVAHVASHPDCLGEGI
jgi:hypothetical protein